MDFTDFFQRATGCRPYPYQERLAHWPGGSWPALLNAPTGAGKTEGAVLAWLWRRLAHSDGTVRRATPRRLVYCLPMRTLVEQTNDRVETWLGNLALAEQVGLTILMGGEKPNDDWRRYPELDYIIVGTQDMLISRALNRGYAQSPYQWPIDFGLLNNDCLWVLDEVQLMSNGLPTTTQMAAFRQSLGTCGPTHTLWMSATVLPQWLKTVDHRTPDDSRVLRLSEDERRDGDLGRRNTAVKTLHQLQCSQSPSSGQPYNLPEVAYAINDKHQPGTLTLAVFNTVARAQTVFAELQRLNPQADLLLVHSRFRPAEREQMGPVLLSDVPPVGRIVVATQAVEAGVDIDARTLFTDLAPWPSLVQRFGRCNRRGESDQAQVYWLDVPTQQRSARNNPAAPYEVPDLERARQRLLDREGDSVGPVHLPEPEQEDTPQPGAVLRRRDLLGLFDTTPDLSGNYLDVSRFVRGGEDTDVSVFWRDWDENEPPTDLAAPQHRELCNLRVNYVAQYLSRQQRRAWRWDYLDGKWDEVSSRNVRPGQTLLLRARDGGYTSEHGWNPDSRDRVELEWEESEKQPLDTAEGEASNVDLPRWVTLEQHSIDVRREMERILGSLDLPELSQHTEALITAAHWHDAGKAHEAFQKFLISKLDENEMPGTAGDKKWAKRGSNKRPDFDARPPRFRHEVASALVLLQHAPAHLSGPARDLAAYLAMAHHGKVRLALRSLPGRGDRNPEARYLLGFKRHEDDFLPATDLGDGATIPGTPIDLSIAQIGVNRKGEPSWLERALALLESQALGPFRLAYLEAMVRMADWRASAREQQNDKTTEGGKSCAH
jgi:CRISPR-associated endonuclease/helicase Cas3